MPGGNDNLMPPAWLTWLTRVTVVAVCPLLVLGAAVTTLQVGMADQRAVVAPHQAIAEMAQGQKSLGWYVEHSHRLAGWFAGICGILLTVGFWFADPRRGFRWLGLVGLSLIIAQGLLGIFRVSLNAWWGAGLAWIHGSFAQIVFATLVGLAVVTSASWQHQSTRSAGKGSDPIAIWSLICLVLVLTQLIFGGLVRHQPNPLTLRLHLFGSFVVLAFLWKLILLAQADPGIFRWTARVLMGLLTLQILLGIEAGMIWFQKYFNPDLAIREPLGMLIVRTAHYFVGSLVFAATAVIALQAQRGQVAIRAREDIEPMPTRLEGAL